MYVCMYKTVNRFRKINIYKFQTSIDFPTRFIGQYDTGSNYGIIRILLLELRCKLFSIALSYLKDHRSSLEFEGKSRFKSRSSRRLFTVNPERLFTHQINYSNHSLVKFGFVFPTFARVHSLCLQI